MRKKSNVSMFVKRKDELFQRFITFKLIKATIYLLGLKRQLLENKVNVKSRKKK